MEILRTLTRLSFACAVTTIIAGCGGNNGPVAPACSSTGSGRMTATINGAPFEANQFARATVQNTTVNGPNIVQINGFECALTPGVARQVLITLGRITPFTAGTYPLDPASQGTSGGYSGIGQFIRAPALWYSNLRDGTTSGSGTITFTTLSSTRLTGSFTFSAVPVASNGAGDRSAVAVSGTFDVPIP